MRCPACRARVADGAKFCSQCGVPLPWFCHACGAENAARNRFCGNCGTPGAATSRAVPLGRARPTRLSGDPERRQLTVMFVDMVGSTSVSVRLDPEDYRDVMRPWRNCVTSLISRYGGMVMRHMGDGVLTFFGYPRAHEHDAEHAIRAGLAIIDAISKLETPAGPPGTLATRVGIATGSVIVGDLIGAGSSLEYPALGETPNFAARLQALAEPNMLVIDEVTRQLVGELFEYKPIGPVELKGIAAPVRPSAVVGEAAVESRFKALHASAPPPPLVGREEEAELIQSCWAKAQGGEGQVLVIVGDPGVGKSRLIAAFEEQLDKAANPPMRLTCSSHFQDTPLHPLIRHLETAAQLQRSDPPDQKAEKFHRFLRVAARLEQDESALLADLLSLPAPTRTISDRNASEIRSETFKAAIQYIKAHAETAPLIVIIEDFHWADPTTSALLDLLVSKVPDLAALLAITMRPAQELPWSRHPRVRTRVLGGLNPEQSATLARHVAAGTTLPEETVARIVDRAQGVPLFIEELTRSVLSSPTSRAGEGSAPIFAADSVPTSLKALLTAKLDQLGSGKDVAQASSVIGREFSLQMLQSVADLPPEQLETAVAELVAAQFIVPEGPPHNPTFVFRHVLIQDAAYESMLRDRRRHFHLRYAEALEAETSGPVVTAPELLAAHFAHAGAAERSIDYYLKAAGRATGRFALTEIIGYLQKGLAQIPKLQRTSETDRRELELLVARGRALIEHRGAGDTEVLTTFERAHELCRVLPGTKLLWNVHDGLANYHFAHSDMDKVAEQGERVLELGHQTGDRGAVILAHRSMGYAKLMLGQFREARRDLERALELYQGGMDITRDAKVSVCAALSICVTMLGLPDAGAAIGSEAIRHAQALRQPVSLNLGLRRACIGAMLCRDASRVKSLAEQLLSNQNEYETFRGRREGVFFSTWARLQSTPDPALHQQLCAELDQLESTSSLNFLPYFMLAAADVIGSQRYTETSDRLISRAARLVKQTNERWCAPEILRLRASLIPDPTSALDLLNTAVALARDQGALLWQVRAVTDLAKLLITQGKSHVAYHALAPVVAGIKEGCHLPDFAEACTLLARVIPEAGVSLNSTPPEKLHV